MDGAWRAVVRGVTESGQQQATGLNWSVFCHPGRLLQDKLSFCSRMHTTMQCWMWGSGPTRPSSSVPLGGMADARLPGSLCSPPPCSSLISQAASVAAQAWVRPQHCLVKPQ